MAFSFSLPLPAVGVLFGDLQLGPVPQPFEVPHVATELDQRARITEAVYRTLGDRGLVRANRPTSEVEDALVLFARAPLGIAVVGQPDTERKDEHLFARAASDGRDALLVVKRENALVFTEVRPTAVVQETVDLLPDVPQARGGPVSVPLKGERPPVRADDDEAYDPFAKARAKQPSSQDKALQRIFAQPILGIGAFRPTVRGADEQPIPVAWVDIEQENNLGPGRYFCSGRIEVDGTRWTTYTPGDKSRIVQYLHGMLAPHLE